MTPIPKEDALEACKTCPQRETDKCCIYADIVSSKDAIHNPPECLIFQFKQISEREHPHPIVSTGTQRPEGEKTSELSPEDQRWVARITDHWNKNQKKSTRNQEKVELVEKLVDNTVTDKEKNSTPTAKPISRKNTGQILLNSTDSQKNSRISGEVRKGTLPKLSKTEKEILRLIQEGIIAPKSLAVAHNCDPKNIYKYLNQLRKKGLIDRSNRLVELRRGTCPPQEGGGVPKQQHAEGGAVAMRVHGQQLWIEILYKTPAHEDKIGTEIFIDGNRVLVWRDVIEVYAEKNLSFIAKAEHQKSTEELVNDATEKSLDYWASVIGRIQNDLKIVLIKNRAQNIRIVKQHIAEVGNEFAKDTEMKGEKFHIYAKEDGKLCMLVDASHNTPEFEFVHPKTSNPDAKRVAPHFADLRDIYSPLPSEVWKTLTETIKTQQKTATTQEEVIKYVKEIGAGLNVLVKILNPQEQKESDDKKKPSKYEENGMYG